MSIKNLQIGMTEKKQWDEKWKEIFDHYQQDLRHAYYIRAILNANETRIMELAAGSFRDVGALNSMGFDCYGCDYSLQAVQAARKQFTASAEKLSEQNCFNLQFADKSFDFTFHNGFWGYFSDDEILQLAKEQARITKYRIATTVHNAHNKQLVAYFDRLKLNDPLYKIRFFEVDEITGLMKSVASNIEIIPVGKEKKYYEDDLINIGLGDAKYIRKSFDHHKMNLLESSERLLCIGEL
jgi:ubiquinone/menaquinone biosynthesis C-methylase UbiE